MIKTIFSNISWQILFEIISVVSGVLLFILLGRFLGETHFGIFTYILSILFFFMLFIDLGMGTYFFRKWSADSSEIKHDLAIITGSRLLMSFLILIPFVFISLIFERELAHLFGLAFIGTVLDVLRSIPIAFARSQNKFHLSSLIESLEKLGSNLGGIIILLLGGGLTTVFVGMIFSKSLALLASSRLITAFPQPTFSIRETFKLSKKTSLLFLLTFLLTLFFKIDVFMIRFFQDLYSVGLYSSVSKIIETTLIIPTVITTSILPVLINLRIESKKSEIYKIILLTALVLFLGGSLGSMIIFFYAPELLDFIYRGQFYQAATAFRILGFTIPIMFLNALYARVFITYHLERVVSFVYLIFIFINIALNSLTIPRLGMEGAAYSTLICQIFVLLILSCYLTYLYQFKRN